MSGAELDTVITVVAIVAGATAFGTWCKSHYGSKKEDKKE